MSRPHREIPTPFIAIGFCRKEMQSVCRKHLRRGIRAVDIMEAFTWTKTFLGGNQESAYTQSFPKGNQAPLDSHPACRMYLRYVQTFPELMAELILAIKKSDANISPHDPIWLMEKWWNEILNVEANPKWADAIPEIRNASDLEAVKSAASRANRSMDFWHKRLATDRFPSIH